MREAILECPCGQPFVLPAPKERLDVLALQRAGTHLPEARFAQLTASQRERSQPICLCGMAAVAVALAEHPQRVRQIIHGNLLSSSQPLSGTRSVLLPTRKARFPEGTRARCSGHLLPRMRRPSFSLRGDRTD